jgi:hypothetical protein
VIYVFDYVDDFVDGSDHSLDGCTKLVAGLRHPAGRYPDSNGFTPSTARLRCIFYLYFYAFTFFSSSLM